MIDEELKHRLDRAISASKDLDFMFKILREYKLSGGTQLDAVDTLEYMRQGASEDYEERLLEIMDFASGFCAPQKKVW